MSVEELTTKFLASIQSKVSNALYNTWFKNMQIMDIEQNEIIINIDSEMKKNTILKNNNYLEIIEKTLKELTNKDYSFELITDYSSKDDDKLPIIEEKDQIDDEVKKYKNLNNNLRKEYTFDSFIVGKSNMVAHTYALEVAKNPGVLYNPFFIYGKSGIGKTHLMHAIGNYIVKNSNKTVLYVTSGQFIEDFTEMTRNRDYGDNTSIVERFKDKYRNIDVLLIDDIQMMRDAKKTQGEFFNTFDLLSNLDKQIVISSDTSPNDLKDFEDRLRTRFNRGMPLSIDPPELDLKIKILKNKVIGMEIADLIDDKVFNFIAENAPGDVRSLEGAINRLLAYTTLIKPDVIDVDFAKEALIEWMGNSQYMTNNVARIRKEVAKYYDVTEESIKSKKRQANINKARQVGMYLSSILTEETIERIGLEFGRDHATVIHGTEKIKNDLLTDEQLKKEINDLKDILTV